MKIKTAIFFFFSLCLMLNLTFVKMICPYSQDHQNFWILPCDFYLRGYKNYIIYVLPLPKVLKQLRLVSHSTPKYPLLMLSLWACNVFVFSNYLFRKLILLNSFFFVLFLKDVYLLLFFFFTLVVKIFMKWLCAFMSSVKILLTLRQLLKYKI